MSDVKRTPETSQKQTSLTEENKKVLGQLARQLFALFKLALAQRGRSNRDQDLGAFLLTACTFTAAYIAVTKAKERKRYVQQTTEPLIQPEIPPTSCTRCGTAIEGRIIRNELDDGTDWPCDYYCEPCFVDRFICEEHRAHASRHLHDSYVRLRVADACLMCVSSR